MYLLSEVNSVFQIKCQNKLKKESECLPPPPSTSSPWASMSEGQRVSQSILENTLPTTGWPGQVYEPCYKSMVEIPETSCIHTHKNSIEGLPCVKQLISLKNIKRATHTYLLSCVPSHKPGWRHRNVTLYQLLPSSVTYSKADAKSS